VKEGSVLDQMGYIYEKEAVLTSPKSISGPFSVGSIEQEKRTNGFC